MTKTIRAHRDAANPIRLHPALCVVSRACTYAGAYWADARWGRDGRPQRPGCSHSRDSSVLYRARVAQAYHRLAAAAEVAGYQGRDWEAWLQCVSP
jgi:hypothetical protein